MKDVADFEELKKFWTDLLRDVDAKPADRMKASEFLLKCEGEKEEDNNIEVVVKIVS